MKLLSSLWSKLAVVSLILSLCIFPIVSTNVYAQDEPGINVTKTADPTQGAPSTEVTFKIVVTNTGDSTLNPVIVNDTLPDGLSYVTGSGAVGEAAAEPTTSDNITLTWDLEALGSSDNATITFNAHIDAGDAGTLTNSVEAIGTPPAGANVSSTATADVTRLAPGINVTKIADPAQGAPSTEVTFEIVVTNTGDSTLNPVIVNDTLPAGLSYIPGNGSVGGVATEPTTSANILTWDLGALGSSDNTTIAFKAHIDPGDAGTLTNKVVAIGTPPAGANVSSTATAAVTRLAPGISITKTADPTKATPSTEVTFEIVVTNTGDCTLDPVKVNDTLPDGLSYVTGSGLVGGVPTPPTTSDNITLTWDLGALDSGVSTTITFKTKIDIGDVGTLTNSVEAIGTPPDGANVSNTATADVTILSKSCWTKAEILKRSGVHGKGINHAPGLQKPFNPNSKAAENAGKKDRDGEEEHLKIRQRTENQGNAKWKLKIRQMVENHQ